VSPRDSLDMVVKRKIPGPCQESNPSHSVCSIVTILTDLSWLIFTNVQSINETCTVFNLNKNNVFSYF
jgi:hypothetical protein